MKKIIEPVIKKIFGNAYVPLVAEKKVWSRKLRGSYFGLKGLDRKLEKYLNYKNGYYVELGANDGIKQSNTYHFELKKGWRGVLIEPSPHNYLACRERRGTNNHVYCNACVSTEYEGEYVDMIYADLLTVSSNLSLDIDDKDSHIEWGKGFLPSTQNIFRYGAVASTLTSLLDHAGSPAKIDLLSLDVEGAELEVLKGVDFTRYVFKYMLIEIRDLPRIENYLDRQGYRLIDKLSEHDYLFTSEPE